MERDDLATDREGTDRRQFLRKAGVVAWTIPAMQVVNMTGALAGEVNTSVTTTSTPPTTRPPEPCEDTTTLRLKAKPTDGGWVWEDAGNPGKNDCIQDGFDSGINPTTASLPVYVSGDLESVKVSHELDDCWIVKGYHKAGSPNQGQACWPAEVAADGSYAVFTAGDKEISHIELLVECCV